MCAENGAPPAGAPGRTRPRYQYAITRHAVTARAGSNTLTKIDRHILATNLRTNKKRPLRSAFNNLSLLDDAR